MGGECQVPTRLLQTGVKVKLEVYCAQRAGGWEGRELAPWVSTILPLIIQIAPALYHRINDMKHQHVLIQPCRGRGAAVFLNAAPPALAASVEMGMDGGFPPPQSLQTLPRPSGPPGRARCRGQSPGSTVCPGAAALSTSKPCPPRGLLASACHLQPWPRPEAARSVLGGASGAGPGPAGLPGDAGLSVSLCVVCVALPSFLPLLLLVLPESVIV